jgi:hypothetical protein
MTGAMFFIFDSYAQPAGHVQALVANGVEPA